MEVNRAITVDTLSYYDCITNSAQEFNLPDVLKTYYLTKCRINEKISNIQLASKDTSLQRRCPSCCVPYDTDSSYKIEPASSISKFARKLLKKQNSGQILTEFQRKYIKRIKNNSNACVITCAICNEKIKIKLEKPVKVKPKLVSEKPNVVKRSKKKKKDIYAGLKIEPKKTKKSEPKPEPKKPSALTLAFCSNKVKKKILNPQSNLPKERSENSKQNKLNKMGKMLKSNPKDTAKNGLKNFLSSIN